MNTAEPCVSPRIPEGELKALALRHLESSLGWWGGLSGRGAAVGRRSRLCPIWCRSLSDLATRLAELQASADRPEAVRFTLERDPGSWLIAGFVPFKRQFERVYGGNRSEWDRYVWAQYREGLERLALESLETFQGEYLVRAPEIAKPLKTLTASGMGITLIASHFSEARALMAEHGAALPEGFHGQECLTQWARHAPEALVCAPLSESALLARETLPAATKLHSEARRFADLMALHPQLTPSAIEDIMLHAVEPQGAVRPRWPGVGTGFSSEADSIYA